MPDTAPPGGHQAPRPSRIAELAQIRELSHTVGAPIRVLPHDEIVRLVQTDTVCSVLIRRIKAREYRYQTVFDSADLVLLSWVNLGGGWSRQAPMVMPDPDFTPYRRQELGEVRDRPAEVKDRLEWEALCKRPGNGTRFGQRDSFGRCLEGDDSPMDTAWDQHRRTVLRSSSDD